MWHWLHHLLNPHCPECNIQAECKSCYTYREQLHIANQEKQRLLELLIQKNIPVHETPVSVPTGEPDIRVPIRVPWTVHRRMVEQADRQQAAILAQKEREIREVARPQTVEELEKELGVNLEVNDATSGS